MLLARFPTGREAFGVRGETLLMTLAAIREGMKAMGFPLEASFPRVGITDEALKGNVEMKKLATKSSFRLPLES